MRPGGKIIHMKKDLLVRRNADELAGGIEEIRRLSVSRRNFLQGAAVLLGGTVLGGLIGGNKVFAEEAVETGKFVFPRLQFTVSDNTPDRWDVHPSGDINLRKKLRELTNINVSMEPKVVRLGDFDEMVRNPFVFMTSEGYFKIPDNEEKNVREFLERGGFILADDCVYNGKEDRFFKTYMELINRLFPDNPMRKIPYDNEIFHIYYDFTSGCPHMQGVPHGAYGLFEPGTGRIMTWNSPGDIHCGWVNAWFGPEKNLASVKMGINIIIYFLSH
ncbi:MAG TPA: hypothetical protein DCZ94_20785 [Lentisphaeria bacterium]|nr:MAG: hypothetical protein A2X48_09065 [Lentisphaerae bacterium GWF2_49_21]HBC89384.1 hypothetical protein [Lentisphaeria bacterium]